MLNQRLRLLLIRHGLAESTSSSDFNRALTERGISEVQNVANKIIETLKNVDITICSSAIRTKQTYEVVKQHIDLGHTIFSEDLYTANSSQDLLEIIFNAMPVRAFKSSSQTIALVGHNPTISELCTLLTDQYCNFVPGQCQLIETDSDTWDEALSSFGLWESIKIFSP